MPQGHISLSKRHRLILGSSVRISTHESHFHSQEHGPSSHEGPRCISLPGTAHLLVSVPGGWRRHGFIKWHRVKDSDRVRGSTALETAP
jgi:hypothetical protein